MLAIQGVCIPALSEPYRLWRPHRARVRLGKTQCGKQTRATPVNALVAGVRNTPQKILRALPRAPSAMLGIPTTAARNSELLGAKTSKSLTKSRCAAPDPEDDDRMTIETRVGRDSSPWLLNSEAGHGSAYPWAYRV